MIGRDFKPRTSSWLTGRRALGIILAYFILHILALTLTMLCWRCE